MPLFHLIIFFYKEQTSVIIITQKWNTYIYETPSFFSFSQYLLSVLLCVSYWIGRKAHGLDSIYEISIINWALTHTASHLVLILTSVLKDIFIGYRIINWLFVLICFLLFWVFKLSFYCLLTCPVSHEKSAILISDSLYIICCFLFLTLLFLSLPLTSLKISPLYFWLSSKVSRCTFVCMFPTSIYWNCCIYILTH